MGLVNASSIESVTTTPVVVVCRVPDDPPFIMRMRGVVVNDVPKIHCKDPTREDHSISFEDNELRIQLQLKGIFSLFHHRIPTSAELQGCDKVFLTPDSTSWNPHCKSFAQNEQSMLDIPGNIVEPNRRTRHLMEPDQGDYSLAEVSALDWDSDIDDNFHTSFHADELYDSSEVSEFASALNLGEKFLKCLVALEVVLLELKVQTIYLKLSRLSLHLMISKHSFPRSCPYSLSSSCWCT